MTRLITSILALVCLISASAQDILNAPVLNQDPLKSGLSAHLAFELTKPTGSRGMWSTGAGGTLTLHYTHYFTNQWFISPGVGAFYSTMGTDYIPQLDRIYEGTVKNYGASVPVMAGYALHITDDLCVSFASGPQLNINVYAKEHATPDFSAPVIEPERAYNLFGCGFNRVDLQWRFYAGLTYKQHYCIGFSGGLGLTNVATMSHENHILHIHRNNVALNLSYKF